MRRLLVVLAACSPSSPPPPAQPAPIARVSDAAVPDAPPPKPAFRARQLPIGPHGIAILELTATEDGSAALSIDFHGGLRLWPALDGTREPISIPALATASEAVLRVGDDFAIATLDAAGGVVVQRVTPTGMLVAREVVASELPLRDVIAIGHGFLAIRDDQAIVRLDAGGHIQDSLMPDHGERVEQVTYRRGETLAILTTPSGMRGQWIETSKRLAWGGVTPPFDIEPGNALLSPGHRYLGAVGKQRAIIVDLSTGTTTPLAMSGRAVGFSDDEHLGFLNGEEVGWADPSGKLVGEVVVSSLGDAAIATDRGLVAGANRDLGIVDLATNPRVRYLGYQTDTPHGIASSPIGVLLQTAIGPVALDAELAAHVEVPWRDATPIDASFALAVHDHTRCPDPTSCAARWISTVDAHNSVVDRGFDIDGGIHYEPATQLVTAERSGATVITTYDPQTHHVGQPATIGARNVVLLDPALAGGAVALIARDAKTDDREPGTEVRLVRSISPLLVDPPFVVPGVFSTADRAGHAYVQDAAGIVSIYAGNKLLGHVEGPVRGWQLRPSPDGKLVALFSDIRITLAELDGHVRWSIALPNLNAIAWSTDGGLVALARGLVRLDLATGEIERARCGWRFGLRVAPNDAGTGDNICDR